MAGLAVFAVAPLALAATGHATIQPSSDSAARLSLWAGMVPPLVGIVLVRAVPPHAPFLAPLPGADAQRLLLELRVLVTMAVLAPTLVLAGVAGGIPLYPGYHLVKLVLFLLVPWVAFRLLRSRGSGHPTAERPERLWRPAGLWRWLGPVPAVAAFAYLAVFSPLALPSPALEGVDPVFLVVAASLTFLTANVLEEIFYRVLLQTRLEAVFGRWAGIVLGALLFALLHVPTHGQGPALLRGLPLTLGVVLSFQGVFGLFAGYLWARYRNVWFLIAAHTVVNTLPLLV